MIKKIFLPPVLFISLSAVLISCRHNSDVPVVPVVSFSNDVQSILTGNCAQSGCHGSIDNRRFSLVTYNDVIASGTVIAGDAHNSNLFKAVTGRNNIMPKPPQTPLTDDQVRFIFIWIAQGAKNN
jgi:hypothetical protein